MTLDPAEPASYRSQRHPSSILEAIHDHWGRSPILPEHFPGGLYVSEVPERLDGEDLLVPYAYVDKTRSDYTWVMSTQYMENCDLDFFLFAPGAELAENCLKSLRGVYDWSEFKFSDNISSVIYMRPESEELTAENTRYRDGRLLYRGHVRYSLCVNRYTTYRRS